MASQSQSCRKVWVARTPNVPSVATSRYGAGMPSPKEDKALADRGQEAVDQQQVVDLGDVGSRFADHDAAVAVRHHHHRLVAHLELVPDGGDVIR